MRSSRLFALLWLRNRLNRGKVSSALRVPLRLPEQLPVPFVYGRVAWFGGSAVAGVGSETYFFTTGRLRLDGNCQFFNDRCILNISTDSTI